MAITLLWSPGMLDGLLDLAKKYQQVITLGVLGSLIAALILPVLREIYRFLKRLKPSLSFTRKVDDFERRLVGRSVPADNENPVYSKYPPKSRNPLYYFRHRQPQAQRHTKPTYHFFIKPDVYIHQFMAFLILPLDGGHGRKESYYKDGTLATFTNDWRDYLDKIRAKADNQLPYRRFWQWRRSRKNHLPPWSRIVFYNRKAVETFLREYQVLFPNGPVDARPDLPGLFEAAALDLKDYVLDLCLIHMSALQCPNLRWRYVEESAIPASNYYDFGLYEVQGIQIVYAPVPFRNGIMDIATEKVYIGRTRRQKLIIDEFVRDYETLWKKSAGDCDVQANLDKTDRLEKDKSWNKSAYLIPAAFELLYGQRLTNIIEGEWGMKLMPRGEHAEE